MKMNLFSAFNPITSKYSSALWLTSIMLITMIPVKMWKMETKTMKSWMALMNTLHTQFKTMMKKSMKPNMIMIMSTMTMILTMNMTSLFPFTYPHTSQPQMTLSLALPPWLAIMMMKAKNPEKLLAHMVPPSTPNLLMPLMVMIETTSTLIQPITLSVRLLANITAGHILVILVTMSHSQSWTSVMTLSVQTMLTMIEMFVSLIQAYVFSMLLTMYTK